LLTYETGKRDAATLMRLLRRLPVQRIRFFCTAHYNA